MDVEYIKATILRYLRTSAYSIKSGDATLGVYVMFKVLPADPNLQTEYRKIHEVPPSKVDEWMLE
jgi:hypothetical protein